VNQTDQFEIKNQFEKIWKSPTGISGWIATVNSRPLGERYLITSLIFFALGICLALVMRSQLAIPDNDLLGPRTYNAVFTMHGSTMLYLFAVPFIEALGIYFIPLLIGSRDLAFPRLTNFGYWLYLFGGLVIYASALFGNVPDAGWTAYPPLSGSKHSGSGLDFWLLGLSMLEIAGITAALEIVVTILKLRAPGMAIQNIPIIVWTYLVTGLMILFAFTPLLIATFMLEMDRTIGTYFFNPEKGGSSLLWQHLFWWFGHPEVYIIFLPATGVISAIIPVFTKRRLIAYPLVVAAIIITGFVSFGLWTHHMYTTGIPELPMHFFTAASYMIAIASGVQVFAWIATLWGARIKMSVQMLYIFAFFIIFVNGGLTGVMVATMPFDWQVQDTNFVVAHFHHVLIGGAVLPLLAGLHHWLPKIRGTMINERWGRISIGLIFIGFNIAFVPLYIAGILGMRRRVYTYPEDMGVGTLNMISTIGAYILAIGFAIALVNLLWSYLLGRRTDSNPWSAGTLEWSVASPPPPHGFDQPPVVRDRYPLWKSVPDKDIDQYTEKLKTVSQSLLYRPATWRATLLTDITNAQPQALQFLPGPSLLPFFNALTIVLASLSLLIKSYTLFGISLFCTIVFTALWVLREPKFNKDEYSFLSENNKIPLESSGTKTIGWWAMLGFITVLATTMGALLFSYFYLRLYSVQWPQNNLPHPSSVVPVIGGIFFTSGTLIQILNRWARSRQFRLPLIYSQITTIILGISFFIYISYSIAAIHFPIDSNAYSSIFFLLHYFLLLNLFLAFMISIFTLIRLIIKNESINSPRLTLWFQCGELFWYFTLSSVILILAVLYFTPQIQ
jgi:cytochrome c oxidase subunit I+III